GRRRGRRRPPGALATSRRGLRSAARVPALTPLRPEAKSRAAGLAAGSPAHRRAPQAPAAAGNKASARRRGRPRSSAPEFLGSASECAALASYTTKLTSLRGTTIVLRGSPPSR